MAPEAEGARQEPRRVAMVWKERPSQATAGVSIGLERLCPATQKPSRSIWQRQMELVSATHAQSSANKAFSWIFGSKLRRADLGR